MNEKEKKEIDERFDKYLELVDYMNLSFAELRDTILNFIYPEIERAEKEELKSYIETLKQIIDLDKTPAYGYDKKEKDKNNIGQFSLAGRWKTPREYCQDMLRDKEQALSEMSKELEGEGVRK